MNVYAQTSVSLKLIFLMIMTYSKFLLFVMLLVNKELPAVHVHNEPSFVPWVGFAEDLYEHVQWSQTSKVQ